jgi:hypothetical protein
MLCSWSLSAQELNYNETNIPANLEILSDCKPIKNLKGLQDDKDVNLSWNAPDITLETGWLTYSDENTSAICPPDTPYNVYIAARWSADDLNDLNGFKITKMKFFVFADLMWVSQTLKIWIGGSATSPGIETYSHQLEENDVPYPGVNQWTVLDVSPITIDATKELWIGCNFISVYNDACAPLDHTSFVTGFSDLISLDGGANYFTLPQISEGINNGSWNIAVYVEDGKGKGSWLGRADAAGTNRADVTGYKIYRDGASIGTTAELTYTDPNAPTGMHQYCVSALYSDGCESDPKCVDVGVADCNPPKYLQGAQTSVSPPEVTVHWKAPLISQEKEVKYCDNNHLWHFGNPAYDATYSIAIRWDVSDLEALDIDGWYISKFRINTHTTSNCSFIFQVYEGGSATDPGTEIYTQTAHAKDMTLGWNDVLITTPIAVDKHKELWLVCKVVSTVGQYVLRLDCNTTTAVIGKSDLVKGNDGWHALGNIPEYNWYGSWCMGMVVEKPTIGKNATLTNYLLYRDDELLKTLPNNNETWFSYSDNTISAGKTYNYCVVAKYDDDCETYPNCILIETAGCNPPKNLTATQTATNPPEVTLSWDVPTKLLITRWDAPRIRAGVLNYLVYRDGVLMETLPSDKLTWKDHNVTAGETYNYCIVARYDDDCESLQNAMCKEITVTSTAVGEMENNIVVYPNPTTGQLHIKTSDIRYPISDISIFDMMGKSVIQFVTLNWIQDNYSTEIDVSQFPAGMYIMRITIGDETTSRKIIKSER